MYVGHDKMNDANDHTTHTKQTEKVRDLLTETLSPYLIFTFPESQPDQITIKNDRFHSFLSFLFPLCFVFLFLLYPNSFLSTLTLYHCRFDILYSFSCLDEQNTTQYVPNFKPRRMKPQTLIFFLESNLK
jgi:hypothetical protein